RDSAAWIELDRSSSRLLVERAASRGDLPAGGDPWVGALERVQRALSDSAAMIGWLDVVNSPKPAMYPFWAFVLRNHGAPRWFRVDAPSRDASPMFQSRIRLYEEALHDAAEWPLQTSDMEDLHRRAHEIYGVRVAPLEPALHGIHDLVVVSPNIMYGVPLEA